MIVFQRFTDGPGTCMYLPEQQPTLQYELVARMTPEEYEIRMNQGWRKFGSLLFHPVCAHCRECRPLRIPLAEFAPDRSQKRCLKQNADLTVRYALPSIDAMRLNLYRRYHDMQAAQKGWPESDKSEEDYADQFVSGPFPGVEISVWEGDILRGVVLTDITPNVVSAIYHYHDPDARERSLGTFLILQTLQMARQMGKAYCYMGYFVAGCASMNYKRRYQPCEVLNTTGEWVRIKPEIR